VGDKLREKDDKNPLAEVIRKAYLAGSDEESLEPHVLVGCMGQPVGRVRKGDFVIFYNLRGEREVELCKSLLARDFAHFPKERDLNLHFVTMIPYYEDLPVRIAFAAEGKIKDTLSEVLSGHGLRQAKVSEAEKAIHVSYFLNGKVIEPYPGEERVVVPTFKNIAFLDQKPEMNALGVANAVIKEVKLSEIQFIFANFANIDVIGHIENEGAIRKAVETVDFHLGRCVNAARDAGVITVITADHGTAEKWFYPDGTVDTGHTDSPVPFLIVDPRKTTFELRPQGELADIAPTILDIFGLAIPQAMTGKSLFMRRPAFPEGKRKVLLLLLDGWGYREEKEGNLIAQARTPVMDALRAEYPFVALRAAGEAVGLPAGSVGNSESGHMHIGAGRRIYADRLRIDRAIEDGSFFRNEALLWAMRGSRAARKNLHLLGIVSFFSSHGSINHLMALLRMAKQEGVENLYLHAMLGRRGERKESGARYIEMIEKEMEKLGIGKVVSIIGRYWALDREENWARIEKTYRMLIYGEGIPVPTI